MSAAPTAESTAQFDMDAAVIRLIALAANKRAERPIPTVSEPPFTLNPFVLCKLSDIPEPSEKWERADAALKRFADELASIGGVDLMVEVYDEAVEQHGYRAVCGVSASWSGCHGWWH